MTNTLKYLQRLNALTRFFKLTDAKFSLPQLARKTDRRMIVNSRDLILHIIVENRYKVVISQYLKYNLYFETLKYKYPYVVHRVNNSY